MDLHNKTAATQLVVVQAGAKVMLGAAVVQAVVQAVGITTAGSRVESGRNSVAR